MRYDVVIIGSGFGGLVCAHLLAKAGKRVLVLERQQQPGGCIQSYQRKGQAFDTGLHYVGGLGEGQTLNRIFSHLGLLTSCPYVSLRREELYNNMCRRFRNLRLCLLVPMMPIVCSVSVPMII